MEAKHGKSTNVQGVLLTVVAIALAGTAGMVGMLREVTDLGPKVGDIVSFDPRDRFSSDMKSQIDAIPVNGTARVACELDVQAMHAGGGSVVIEAHESQGHVAYRVHWAGARTSVAGADCGRSADLMLSETDLATLAIAAGGYGAAAKTLASGSVWRSADGAQ
jgi:hypothetical protein